MLESHFSGLHGELLGTLYHLLGNMDDAHDCLQETFIKCWRHREQLPEIENVRAWIFRIAVNTGRDMRMTAWRRKRQALGDQEQDVPSSEATPVHHAQRSEQMERLRLAVLELRDEEREVFLLRQNGDLTYEAIAETLSIPLGTVKTRMRMALSNLRQHLAPAEQPRKTPL
ncbi:sigma-70 family RNA polymerase sigma factor [bacterium]|nr:sigma-70 family RNA polymerase sigma factor [bacterium]